MTPRQAFIPVPSAWEYPYAVYAAEIKSSCEGEDAALTVTGILATDENGTVVPLGGISNVNQGWASTVQASTDYSTVSGGHSNTIGHVTNDGDYCTVGGGYGNTASDWGAAVGGGYNNTASGSRGTVGGGDNNTASGSYATVGGGWYNNANQAYGTVAGGYSNTASGNNATVGGGSENTADKIYATIAGGYLNKANGDAAFVGGGRYNEASGLYSCVPGGRKNRAVHYAFAAGYRAKAAHKGSFVWADSTEGNLVTTAQNQFLARAKGGVKFFTNAAMTSGAKLNPGGGSWVNLSDRNAKENIEPIDTGEILERLVETPIQTWNYKSQDDSIRHIGVMAQDLHQAFGFGVDDKGIATVDADGIAMAAIQGLNQKVEDRDAEIESLRRELNALKRLVERQSVLD
jgi:hypothetical protein